MCWSLHWDYTFHPSHVSNFFPLNHISPINLSNCEPNISCNFYNFKEFDGNTLWAPFDIQRSKLIIAKCNQAWWKHTIDVIVFSTKFGNISYENFLLEGNEFLGTNAKPNALTNNFWQNVEVNCFSQSTNQGFQGIFCVAHHTFWMNCSHQINLRLKPQTHFSSFLLVAFSHFLSLNYSFFP